MTNAERIRNMTIEELLDFLCESKCDHCVFLDDPVGCDDHPCKIGYLKWLNEEVENER